MSNVEPHPAYDQLFFETMDRDACRSAQVILPLLSESLSINSVVDFGCGNGEWLRIWKNLGVEEVLGIDGEFVCRDSLRVDASEFLTHDLNHSIDLGRKFDLVQSLEVAEHLPETSANRFVDSLVAHGDAILFSAAVKGQMGIQHVNEQSYGYWRDMFTRRGFQLLDWIRPKVHRQPAVAYWYRYNILFFVHETKLGTLPAEVERTKIPGDQAVPDWASLAFRLRRGVTRWLPVNCVDRVVRLCHHMERRAERNSGRS